MVKNAPVFDLFGESRLGLGCMALSGLFGHVERKEAIRTIHRAIELGIRHFDTAELYGPYIGEEILGEALGARPEKAIVATKVGYKIFDGKKVGLDSRPMSLRLAVEGSLRRLRRDRIDLVYQHRQDPAVPIEDAIGTLAKLRSEGKIGKVGLSAIDGATLARASAIVKIAAVQNEYSLLHRESAKEILGEIESSSTAFVAYSPLARGLLSETARVWTEQASDDYRRQDVRFSPERLAVIRAATKSLHKIAAERQVAVPIIALSWLLSKSPNLAILPGCKSLAQVSVVVEATKFSLHANEIDLLDGLAVEGSQD